MKEKRMSVFFVFLSLLQTSFLSLMCYNFGIDTYHHQKFEECTFWLRYIIAKVLRLLATAYLEWDALRFHGEALIAVDMANKVRHENQKITCEKQQHVSSVPLLSEMCEHLWALLKDHDTLESAVKLLLSENREAPAFELLKRASQQFESSPALGTALVLHIELLLHRDKELLGKQKIEDVINGAACRRTHLCHVYKKMSRVYQCSTSSQFALQWYNYSLSFFQAGDMDSNLAKLQRNRTFCFMQLKQLEKAKEAVHEAERCDPDSIFTQFSLFKIAMHENDAERGGCLENLLAAIRCHWINLSCLEPIVSYKYFFSAVIAALQKLSQRLCLTAEQCTEEANWFRKIAWNAALQCESNPDRMRDFFVLSYQLSQMCRPDRAILMAQKTCLLMAAAAALEWCRAAPHADRVCVPTDLSHLKHCHEFMSSREAYFPDPTDTLLLLYEFEARAKLNDPEVASVLDSILEQDNVEAKVLQTIAALAMEPPAHFPLLCKKALRVALSVHKKQAQVDPTQCSQCIHSLIKLSLPSGASQMEARLLHEAWDYYEEALAVIAASPDALPETQILWLLTRAWNTGILLYSLARYLEAEKWCGLGMSFVRHLGPLQDSYKTQVGERTHKVEI
uniref:Protein ZIP4 homolog n=1 Tax=Hippocampus comes TaxID=109280 RepID=A0A3Q3D538_HIPCM